MNYNLINGNIYINNIIEGAAIILDCDGTLVDISESYNACIKHTVGFFLEKLDNKPWYNFVTDRLIQILRASGGFNNDIDTSYVCILMALASKSNSIEDAREFAYKIASKSDARGIVSIEEALSNYDIHYPKNVLNYPSKESILIRTFDEFFYGKELFKQIYGIDSNIDHGFIEYDRLIITNDTLEYLKNKFNDNIAIVSGRSKIATKYTLKNMINKFNLNASVFIEDEERNGNKMMSKPSPYSLIRSLELMNVNKAICVGDSVEDLLMSKNAKKYGYDISFIGIYENGLDSNKQLSIFTELNADIIIRNVNLLPNVIK